MRWSGASRLQRHLDDGPVILGFWHEHLAVLGPLHADRQFVGMVSRSRDGERLSSLLSVLGFETVRGSSSAGARAVARASLRALRGGRSLAIALDGPRGPRHEVAPGAAVLARWAQRPLLLVGCRAWPALRLRSWDRQCLPLPFAQIEVRYERCGPYESESVQGQLRSLCLSDPSEPEP